MKRYNDAAALRRALETRLKQESESASSDLGRLRRRVVFDRLAARLSADQETRWILKGGAALEFRLRDRARATKDLDLAVNGDALDGATVREMLIEALTGDPDGDWFSFRVQEPVALAPDTAGRGAWRFSVEAWLAGKPFASIRLDVAARGDELAATEQLELLGTLSFADIPARSIEAVERRQHFAEKLHALLLAARHRVVGFIGRVAELAELAELARWRDDPWLGLSVTDLLGLIAEHLMAGRIWVLLLARPAGLWWDALRSRLGADFAVDTETLLVEPLAADLPERVEVFVAAMSTCAVRHGCRQGAGVRWLCGMCGDCVRAGIMAA